MQLSVDVGHEWWWWWKRIWAASLKFSHIVLKFSPTHTVIQHWFCRFGVWGEIPFFLSTGDRGCKTGRQPRVIHLSCGVLKIGFPKTETYSMRRRRKWGRTYPGLYSQQLVISHGIKYIPVTPPFEHLPVAHHLHQKLRFPRRWAKWKVCTKF